MLCESTSEEPCEFLMNCKIEGEKLEQLINTVKDIQQIKATEEIVIVINKECGSDFCLEQRGQSFIILSEELGAEKKFNIGNLVLAVKRRQMTEKEYIIKEMNEGIA